MPLRDWPPRLVVRIWVVGLALEAALLLAPLLASARRQRADEHQQQAIAQALVHPESLTAAQRGALPPGFLDSLRAQPRRDRILSLRATHRPDPVTRLVLNYLPIPLVLGLVTAAWSRQRRHIASSPPPSADA